MERFRLYVKRIGAFILFILAMVCVNEALHYILTDDINSYTRISMHELYEQKQIDALFLGSSHSYRSIDTALTDEIWGINTFNAGTSSQNPVDSYYLLKEAAKKRHISKVYMEVYYLIQGQNTEYHSPTATYIVSDYMKFSPNRLLYIWDSGGKDYLAHGLILGRRNWQKLFSPSEILDLVHKKSTASYRNFEYVRAENEEYAGKGFVRNYEEVKPGTFSSNRSITSISEEAISEYNQKYLNKIIDFCKKEDIELVFYSSPISDFQLQAIGNYDSYISQMNEFLEGKNVPYYDFGLSRSSFLDLDDSCFMVDGHHLNGKGATIFTQAFASLFGGNEETDTVFWDSYDQKMAEEEKTVFGVICLMPKNEAGEIEASIIPVHNMTGPLYFKVTKRNENEEEYVEYCPFSEETTFVLPAGESGYVHIYVATDINGENITNDATFYYK
ncbi:MAG: hypothetical protein J1D87_05905 [Lachnospiraceae bacterium]|nr:hypothetical protein [Lachnospiraceae bacterium]